MGHYPPTAAYAIEVGYLQKWAPIYIKISTIEKHNLIKISQIDDQL